MDTLVNALLAPYAAVWGMVTGLEPWAVNLVISLVVLAKLGFAGFAVAFAGRSPLWVLLLLVPYVELVAVWVFAFAPWPGVLRPGERGADALAGREDRA